LGVDLVEIAKAKSFYKAHAGCLNRYFSEEEISFIAENPESCRKLAMLLAAKEAVFKSLDSVSWMGTSGFKDIRMVAHDDKNLLFSVPGKFGKKKVSFLKNKRYVVAVHHQNVGGRPPKMEVACVGI